MLGFFKPKRADVLSHWYSLVPNFNTSTDEFYQVIENELKQCNVPGLAITRVEFSEGGLLSAKREYLRMTRERLVFDICAAPFGSSYFFSCRFAEIPAVIELWQMIVLLLTLGVLIPVSFVLCARMFGLLTPFVWPAGWIGLIICMVYVMRNAVAIGLQDFDAMLIRSPFVGSIYERWFRKETYYRQDTRLMYCDTINDVVKAKVEETTGAKGIKLIEFNEYSPILGELYKPTMVTLQKTSSPP